jgi:CheY-like chemotaxis protein
MRAADRVLDGYCILVVEDNFFIAEDVCDSLHQAGAEIVGPVGNIDEALQLARKTQNLDCAVLDLNLHGETVEEIARVLHDRSVGFFFVTGYETGGISEAFSGVPRLIKPFNGETLITMVRQQSGIGARQAN